MSGVKKTRLDPGLFRTASQLSQANELKAKKQPRAKASLGSAALDRARCLSSDSTSATRLRLSEPAAAFNRDSHITYSKFGLTHSSLETGARPKVAKKKKVVRQLEVNIEKMKNLEEYDPERRAKEFRRESGAGLWTGQKGSSQRVKQRQMERQKKHRDIIKIRKQAKVQTKMKRLKKKDCSRILGRCGCFGGCKTIRIKKRGGV
ncbi:hypothetical protein HPB52_002526 [Rhipicephalus sanguineus]|uniref:Uncharacterized protein n=1 Tax=Rhipicephalus sanguineus TaxID=34632 RepID=A0A9D4PCD1_RHISA|nr:hypothetical protein HPB52_002526 [Rhipicephalus sanguineus]